MACADDPARPPAPASPGAGAGAGAARDGFGARLRRLRSERGLTQVELAGSTISPGLVSLLESGRREPSIRTLDYLAQRLGCQPSDLLVPNGAEDGAPGVLAVLRAEVALRSGAPAEALAAFTAVARAPHPVPGLAPDRPLLGRAQALEAVGRVAEAIDALEQLRDAGADGRACWFPVATSLGCCYLRVGRYRTGDVLLRELYEEMEALEWAGTSDHARVVAALIELALQRGRRGEAVDLAARHVHQELPAARPARAAALAGLSLRAERAGRLDEATLLAERAAGAWADEVDVRSGARLKLVAAKVLTESPYHALVDLVAELRVARDAFEAAGWHADVAACEVAMARAEARGRAAP